MKSALSILPACLCCALVLSSAPETEASLTFTSGLTMNRPTSLVLNGSFELAAPPDGVQVYWANSSNSPYAIPPLWLANDNNNLAVWGNDGPTLPYRLKSSDVLPDGRAAVDFRTTTGVTVSPRPIFNPNGEVTFASPPSFVGSPPVILRQIVNTQLTPSPSYNLSFWISGEENATNQGFTTPGIIGMQLSNVLPGDPIQWLAVPNVLYYGQSQVYQYTFTPINPLLPVDIRFINPGGLDLSAYSAFGPIYGAFGTQPILDDVIINGVPEPASISLLSIGGLACGVLGWRRRARRQNG